ncbi:MAG: NAD(P)-dependent oxidoreductase [Acidimicrobiales bacterium]
MSRILITGATGRVAGVVARELAVEHDIVALARFTDPAARERLEGFGVECVTADMAGDLDAVPDDAEILMNFAVSFSPKWDSALAVNAEALGHLVDRLPRLERLLHCSTMGVYALSADVHGEDAPLGDSNQNMMPTYSISKIAGEVMARYLARSRGIPTTIARLASPYGNHGGFPWFHLLPILAGEPVTLHTQSPCFYNLIHEDDLVASLPLLLEAADVPATVLNWGDPVATSAEEWCEELARLVGRELTIERSDFAPPPGHVDTTKLADLGYAPRVDWREGMARMVQHLHPDEFIG